MRRAIMSSPCCWPMTRLPSASPSCSTASSSFFTIRPDRNAGPVGDDAGHGLRVDRGHDQRRFALQRLELVLLLVQLGQQLLAIDGGRASGSRRPARRRCRPRSPPADRPACRRRAAARAARAPCRRCPSPPASAARARPGAPRSAPSFSATSVAARADVDADRRLALDDAGLDLERLDAPPAVLDLGRHRVLADRDAGAGGVEQAHRLVGQLARRDVAVRELAPPTRSPRRAAARGGASRARWPRRAASAPPSARRARAPARPGSAGSAPDPSRCASCTRPRWWRRWCAGCRAPAPASAGWRRRRCRPRRRRRPACAPRR